MIPIGNRPSIYFYFIFSADVNYNSAVINTNVQVNDTGTVLWLSHGIYRSSCNISVEFFPFDIQICKMKWASWTYDSAGVSKKIRLIFFCPCLREIKKSQGASALRLRSHA